MSLVIGPLANQQGNDENSVYVRNLEERIKPELLKGALTAVFAEYGSIIDVVARTNLKAKGQAFVVFDRPESALRAIDEVQGFELFDKPMQLALARTRSDATVASTGNKDEFELHQRRRLAEKGKRVWHCVVILALQFGSVRFSFQIHLNS